MSHIIINKLNINHEYDISINGFIPDICCKELPFSFKYLQPILDNLHISDITIFRDIVITTKNNINIFTINNLQYIITNELNLAEIKFLYSITSLITHKYTLIEPIIDIVPNIISIPFYYSAKYLGLPIVRTFSTDMYNWSLINNKLPFSLYNIKLNYSLLGTTYEAWFIIVTIVIEQNSANIIEYIKKLYSNLLVHNLENIKKYLLYINNILYNNINIIKTLNTDTCNPHYFYNTMRPILEGFWDKEKFPNGLILEDVEHDLLEPKGGSAGQSVLIQIINILFGIEFYDEPREFIKEIRNYMPIKHRTFIEEFTKLPKLKDYIIKINNLELINIYNIGIHHIINFRKYHLTFIFNYIIHFNNNSIGTGGTSPHLFLSKMIDNTKKSLITLSSKL